MLLSERLYPARCSLFLLLFRTINASIHLDKSEPSSY